MQTKSKKRDKNHYFFSYFFRRFFSFEITKVLFSNTITKPLIPNRNPPKSMSLRYLLNLGIPKYGTEGLPTKNVTERINKKNFDGLME